MSDHSSVSVLHVQNEAFLIASTIERCPKTMMLRELVTNALEAAAQAADGPCIVTITAQEVAGASKLRIWNTGPGLSASELHAICDLASSLHKENGLDQNFGMGAKVATLPSNKHGLRYRSCHGGIVSEVTLGQRDGVYGRLLYEFAAGAGRDRVDVTDLYRSSASTSLTHDWTEVVLFGNRADQDTVRSPYDDDPPVDQDWIRTYLAQRFYRIPPGVSLTIGTDDQPWMFRGLHDRFTEVGRLERVETPGGIVVHYGYVADVETAAALPGLVGMAAIIHRDEIYALREGQSWLLDAPNFGMAFGARHLTVLIELPVDYGIRPEMYRQFLRYADGDQRQVFTSDFAAIVREAMPQWMRDVVASFGSTQASYTENVTGELRELLMQLGVTPATRGPKPPRTAESKKLAIPAPAFEIPPEIISLRDPVQVDERDLQGRAGRYYPASHQVFVNLTYVAAMRLAMQLEHEFESAPDPQRRRTVARDLAEWTILRQVGRAVVYSLAKRDAGWPPDAVTRAQSPESLSLVADDFTPLLPLVRERMAEILGMALPVRQGPALSGHALADIRRASVLLEAEQAARKALGEAGADPVPSLIRVSMIQMQAHSVAAALDWARRAVEAAPQDYRPHQHLAGLRLQQHDLAGAEQAARTALDLGAPQTAGLWRQISSVMSQRGDGPAALEGARRAIAADPQDPWSFHHLAGLLLQQHDLDGAEEAARTALDLGVDRPSGLLRQLSSIHAQRGNLTLALDWAHRAVTADPQDSWNHHHLSGLLLQQEDLDGAAQSARLALKIAPNVPGVLRQISVVEARRQNYPEALRLAHQAVAADAGDAWSHHHLAGLLLRNGDIDNAAQAAQEAVKHARGGTSPFLRQLSSIQVQRGDLPAALATAAQAITANPNDHWNHHHLSGVLLHRGELDAAKQAILRAVALGAGNIPAIADRMSEIESHSRRAVLAASAGVEQAGQRSKRSGRRG